MLYIYDVLLNLSEKAYDFYEWNIKDDIEHIKKIKLFKVDEETLKDFYNNNIKIDISFLEKIYKTCEKYDFDKLKYCCLFTDSKIVLGLEFSDDGNLIYKSRLLPDDEEEIVKYIKNEENEEINYEIITEKNNMSFFTRREEKIKKILETEINNAYQNKEYQKLKYMYLEYFDEIESNYKKIKKKLLDSMIYNLDYKHINLYDTLMLSINRKKV